MPRPTYGAPTSRPWKRYLLPGVGFIALVIAVVYINASVDSASYPFHVWRMDLDDFVANAVLVVGAIAGIWKVKLEADKANREADKANRRTEDLERKFNGGMAEVARTHMQDSEVFASLSVRMDRMEQERDDCIEERKNLQQWVIQRLDQTGLGRSGSERPNQTEPNL